MKFLGNKRFTQEKMTLSSLKDLRLSDTELAIIEQYFLIMKMGPGVAVLSKMESKKTYLSDSLILFS